MNTGSATGASPDLAIIDYGMGNLRSVARAWEAVGASTRLVATPEDLGQPDALIFPGQGAIVDTMSLLCKTGWDHVVRDWVAADRPFFGICLGLQALFEHSEEGDTPCLGIFPGEVRRFRFPKESGLKVPHMGWNNVEFGKGVAASQSFEGRSEQFYFVHSYYVEEVAEDWVWGRSVYGDKPFCSALARSRCHATQFHPEKSQAMGLQLYRGFLEAVVL